MPLTVAEAAEANAALAAKLRGARFSPASSGDSSSSAAIEGPTAAAAEAAKANAALAAKLRSVSPASGGSSSSAAAEGPTAAEAAEANAALAAKLRGASFAPATGDSPPSGTDDGPTTDTTAAAAVDDPLYDRLRSEALRTASSEPSMSCLLSRTVLHPSVSTYDGAVAATIAHRLALACGPDPDVCPNFLRTLFAESLVDPAAPTELGHPATAGIRADALAHVERDPACETLLEAVLFFKGYAAAVTHRVARRQWYGGARFSALWLQSQASAAFGVDLHPAASVGIGVMFDHATGVVVGETATIGDGCTILHGVTLGGTGKDSGDRHPKVGRGALIGANASVLGNITIGDGAKIGAGSVVLRPVPHGATAVGSPAKIIGWAKERDPGSNIDQLLVDVVQSGSGKSASRSSSRMDSTASLTSVESATSLQSRDGSGSEEEGVSEANGQANGKVGEGGQRKKTEEETPPTPGASEDKAAPNEAPSEDGGGHHKLRFNDIRPPTRKHRSLSYPLESSQNDLAMLDDEQGREQKPQTPAHKTLEDLPDNDCCSPFRDFRLRHAPPGCVTYCSLRALLRSGSSSGDGEGPSDGCDVFELRHRVTDAEVGEVFWELLRRTGHPERRYVPRATFERSFVEVASGFTGLGEGRCRELLERAATNCPMSGGGKS